MEDKYYYYTIFTGEKTGWRVCKNSHPLEINNLNDAIVTFWKEISVELAESLIEKYGISG